MPLTVTYYELRPRLPSGPKCFPLFPTPSISHKPMSLPFSTPHNFLHTSQHPPPLLPAQATQLPDPYPTPKNWDPDMPLAVTELVSGRGLSSYAHESRPRHMVALCQASCMGEI